MKHVWILALVMVGCSKASPAARDLQKHFDELDKATKQIVKEMHPFWDRMDEAERRKDEGEKERIDREGQPVYERLGPLMKKQKEIAQLILERSDVLLKQNSGDADILDIRTRFVEEYVLSGPPEREGRDAILNEFIEQTERLAKLRPDDRSILVRRAGALRMAGRYSEARETLAKALKSDPGNARLLFQDGLAAYCLDDYDASVRELEGATADPDALPYFLHREAKVTLLGARERREHWRKELELRRRDEGAGLPRVRIATAKGDIELELFEDDAPNTVANFVSLVDSKFYDGTRYHRVIRDFMARGGDPNTRDGDPKTYGHGGPGYAINDELEEGKYRRHFRGSLSMANSGPNTNGSQFFITFRPTDPLDGRHTVFGRVISGMDVVDSLKAGDVLKQATVLRRREHPYRPVISTTKGD